jgi:hypothetical protein
MMGLASAWMCYLLTESSKPLVNSNLVDGPPLCRVQRHTRRVLPLPPLQLSKDWAKHVQSLWAH